MKRSVITILVLLTLLVVAFLIPQTAAAQESAPFYWEYVNVDIDVQENGDMLD